MGDYISNRRTRYEICPKCGNKSLRIMSWEEHLEAWGFQNYKTEYFQKSYCNVCHEDTL